MDFDQTSYDYWNEQDHDYGEVVHEIVDAVPHHTDGLRTLSGSRNFPDTSHQFLLQQLQSKYLKGSLGKQESPRHEEERVIITFSGKQVVMP